MLHMNGSNGGGTFTDEIGKAMSLTGTPYTDTDVKKFGSASMHNEANEGIYTADSDDWDFGTGDFTWQCWVNWETLPSGGGEQVMISQRPDASNYQILRVVETSGTWAVQFYATASPSVNCAKTGLTLSTGTWYHIAAIGYGGVYNVYVDGVAGSADTGAATMPAITGDLHIGRKSNGASLLGYIDEVRIDKGVALWTGAFTPPTVEYSAGYKLYGTTVSTVYGSTINKVYGV
jgi:hypothetical protein